MFVSPFRFRHASAVIVVTAAALLPAAPAAAAAAGTVTLIQGDLRFTAAAGYVNDVVVTGGQNDTTGTFRVTDLRTIRAGAGCAAVPGDPRSVTCTARIKFLQVMLGDRNDRGRLDVTGVSFQSVSGGAGNDTLTGGQAVAGTFLHGNEGDDVLLGGAATDWLYGGPGADQLSGGPDIDVARYEDHTEPVWADADGESRDDGARGEGDTILSDVENLTGGDGADFLVGTAGPNSLHGGKGADWLYGFGGDDILTGAEGDDSILGGANNDIIRGDEGADSLYGEDGNDEIAGGPGADSIEGNAGWNTCDPGPDGAGLLDCQVVRTLP